MTDFAGRRIVSTLAEDGTLTVELAPLALAAPHGSQIAVLVEAAPINPSDLALLFGTADMEQASYMPGKIVAGMAEGAARAMKRRHGLPLPVGNECAGTVIAAGEDPVAQALIGKRVGCVPGMAFATHALADAHLAIVLPDGITAEQGASCFVNPMTALGFVETMKRDGFSGLVHTAAASNLGQMLVRICAEDGVPLVNVVRSPDQVALLKELGAEHALDSNARGFMKALIDAIAATGAMMAFDPIRGGTIDSQILAAMEAAAQRADRNPGFSIYGSSVQKRLYVYGGLDLGPMIFQPGFDFAWRMGGWLLPYFLAEAGPEVTARMRARVQAELTTTFASHYQAHVSLDTMLMREAVSAYNARRTGEKYLLLPNG
jgi:NADPH:quinone reductase-like Zn-dependent oxidoreductase